MSTYRRMRRQARLARRSGLQPMMVINAGEPFPETVGVLLARWVWRYRSELAPVGVAAGIVAAAWWLHRTRPHWWLLLAVLTGVAAWAVAVFGARWRFPTLLERVYAAITIYLAGAWLSCATAVGPSDAATSASRRDRRGCLVGAVVGAPAPAREGAYRAQAPGVA